MSPKIPDDHPLHRFFEGVVGDAFYNRLGICAPRVVAYLSDLLTHFVHIRNIYPLKSPGGDVLQEVTDMLSKAYFGPDVSGEERDKLLHRHIGDYTLYWTGLFPESLGHFRARRRKDYFVDYYVQGKRSYGIASELTGPEEDPPAMLFRQLSDHFENCAYALTLARESWDD